MSSSTGPKRPSATIVCSIKRRNRCNDKDAHAAAVTANMSSPWVSLDKDLVDLIGWLVLDDDLLDYVRFRAMCTNWRSNTKCPRGHGIVDPRFHPRRWMMLPEGNGLHPGHGKLRGYIRFFNLSTGLPLFKDHCVLDSVDGILLLQRDHDSAIRLLHPFTGDITELLPLETLLKYVNVNTLVHEKLKWSYVRDVRAASVSVSSDGVITVMMWVAGVASIAFANSGDHLWRVSKWWVHTSYSPISFQGKIYTVYKPIPMDGVHIFQIDSPQHGVTDLNSSSQPTGTLIARFPASPSLYVDLVEYNSELLVFTLNHGNLQYSFYTLAVLIMERIIPMTSIGGNALFLGGDRKLCVSSKTFPTIVGDTIVFLHREDLYLAQYHLGRGHCHKHRMDLSNGPVIYPDLLASSTISTHAAFLNNGIKDK